MIAPPVKNLEGLMSIAVKSVSNILIIRFKITELPLRVEEFF